MSGLLSNAISGLQASQNALRTAGHNISNANTAGYSRQQVEYATRPEQQLGSAGFIGSGVSTVSIERIVNQFVTTQLRLDTSAFHQLNTYNTNIGKVDKLVADANTGLSQGLQSFFSALQNAADDPSSTPARQLVVNEAESLSNRFNNLHGRLTDIEKNINSEIKTVAQQVTSLASSVAQLNQKIAELSGGGGNPPNDLLDQRDEALRRLSELVSVQVVTQDGRDVNVFIGSGQPLVVGTTVSRFSVSLDGEVLLTNGVQSANVTDQLNGGKLGGLVGFREDILAPSMNQMGRLAIVLADTFNRLQGEGLDLDGDYGQPMFADINDLTLARNRVFHGSNADPQNRVLNVMIEDAGQLNTSDYSLRIMPGSSNYVVTRLEDDTVVAQGALNGNYPAEIGFDGLLLTLEGGSFQGGDNFTIKPTVNGARDIDTEITRPQDIALAAPVRTGTDIGNVGTGVINAGEVLSFYDAEDNRLPAFAVAGQLSPPVVIHFTSATTYEVLDNSDPANPVPLQPPIQHQTFIPGIENPMFSNTPGETRIIGDGARTGLPPGSIASSYPPDPVQTNGYLAEQYTFTSTNPDTGASQSQVIVTSPNASASQTAGLISSVSGVSANAYTTATLTDINVASLTAPTQISINGEPLIQYLGGVPIPGIADPATDPSGFYTYLAEQINSNENLATLGLHAVSGANADGVPELRLVAASGANLDIRLESAPGDSLGVHDSNGNPTVALTGSGTGNQSGVTLGGRIDITMDNGVRLNTAPTDSQLLGDSSDPGFAQSSYLGYQVTIKGQPQAGDSFTVDFNNNASNDNRNGLRFAALDANGSIDGGKLSFSDAYGELVERVGTKSSLSRINTTASQSLLEQTQALRDSVSGVNLDEEAANLIKFEQVYSANARVISVARDLFDTLLNAI
ncbi:MAG TPA: flagellar hook-associated protein FlgK [Cellvibrionaceae bacterium]